MTTDRQPYMRPVPNCPECGGPPDTGAGHDCEPSGPTPSERLRLDLHNVVCRVRPDGLQHAFVFDPQGILSDCRFLRDRLIALNWSLDIGARAIADAAFEADGWLNFPDM